jgi:hypothetical protein
MKKHFLITAALLLLLPQLARAEASSVRFPAEKKVHQDLVKITAVQSPAMTTTTRACNATQPASSNE